MADEEQLTVLKEGAENETQGVELVPLLEEGAELAPETNPVVVYLARLASRSSRRTMARCLQTFAEVISSCEVDDPRQIAWWALRYPHTQALRAWLIADSGLRPATINKHLSALRGVLRECWRLELMSSEHYQRAIDIGSVRAETLPSGRRLDAGELRALFRACAEDSSGVGTRDAAMLGLLYGCGLRRQEVSRLELGDVDVETGEVRVRYGKGRKERLTYLPAGGRSATASWCRYRGSAPGPLLVRMKKGGGLVEPLAAISSQTIYDRCRKRARDAGLSFSPHDLRRTAVTDLLDLGEDLAIVQRLVGHASVVTTSRYDRRGEAAKRRAAERLHVPYNE